MVDDEALDELHDAKDTLGVESNINDIHEDITDELPAGLPRDKPEIKTKNYH